MPHTCEYVTLCGKEELRCYSINLKIGRLSWIVQVGPLKIESQKRVLERCDNGGKTERRSVAVELEEGL